MKTPTEIHAEAGITVDVKYKPEYRTFTVADIAKIMADAKAELKPLLIDQAIINKIVQVAKDSEYGLDDADMQPDIEKWSSKDFGTLAHCLVSSWSAKYDLVSIFAAAMKVVYESKAESKGVCEWKDRNDTYKDTSCDRLFFTNLGKFCPGCGKEIKIV